MYRRRRRRSTQIWLPTYGNAHDDPQLDSVIGSGGGLPVLPNGEVSVDAFPVTFDSTESAWKNQYQNGTQTLHDVVAGQEWKLLRVVGKVHAAYGGPSGPGEGIDHPPACEFAAGLIVLRTDEEGNLETDLEEHNPLAQEAADDPWIWRRKWVLTSANHTAIQLSSNWPGPSEAQLVADASTKWPVTTAGYGSVADGPHIDQKTRRRIGREERLYWILAARQWDPTTSLTGLSSFYPGSVLYQIDNRFVGRLSSRMGNRNNASR